MKVLFSAFSCCPGSGSEPGIGWNWLLQALREHEVWVLTTDEFKTKCEEAAPAKAHFIFLPSFERWKRLQETIVPGLGWLYYYWWQWKAYRVSRALHSSVHFDVAHHATFGSWRAPSFLFLLPIPFIWGPIGGGETLPRSFRGELGWKGRLVEALRGVSQYVSRFDPFVCLTIKRATTVIASNPDTAAFISNGFGKKVEKVISCAGIGRSDLVSPKTPIHKERDFVVVFAGMLEPRKGCSLAIKAFSRFAAVNRHAKLVIIGDGPERRRLENLAQSLGHSQKIDFLGRIERPEVFRWMRMAQALLFPSLRDSGGFVILEAMLAGLPIICLDLGGPGYLVNDDCGIKVPASSPGQAIEDLAKSLQRLRENEDLRASMGAAGSLRAVALFDWNRKGDEMLTLFKAALGAEV